MGQYLDPEVLKQPHASQQPHSRVYMSMPRKGTLEKNSIGFRIKQARVNANLTQLGLSKLIGGVGRSAIAQWERNEANPSLPTINKVAKLLNVKPESLTHGLDYAPVEVAPSPEKLGYVLVPEITFGDKPDTRREQQKWGLPYNWLKTEIGVSSPEAMIIYKVEVSFTGSQFEMGDRILVDTGTTRPSPAGTFLYWSGFGPEIGEFYVVPQIGSKKAVVKIKTPHGEMETEIDKIAILGRVKGKMNKV
jgi:transcriptional regulator with XRE-family HTH domain